MWEGFKVKQIVLANTGMENAPPPLVETIPKLAVSAAGSVSIAAEQIQTGVWGYFPYSLMS